MDEHRIAQLESWLRTGSVAQRKAAIDALADYPSDLAVPILQRLATEPDFLCRRFVVMGLGNHRTAASFQVLSDLLQHERDDTVLAEIANSLFEFGDAAIPLLHRLFECNRHWLTRQTILSILMESGQDEVLLEVIRDGLQDQTQTVKETAILALGVVLRGAFHDHALALLADLAQASDWRDRWRAATALTVSPDPRAKKILARLQHDESHYVVAAALEAGLLD